MKLRPLSILGLVLLMAWSAPVDSETRLTGQAGYWFDDNDQTDLATATHFPYQSSLRFSPGNLGGTLWLRIPIDNTGPPVQQLLRMGPTLLQAVEFWQKNGEEVIDHQRSGLRIPMAERRLPEQEILFPLTLTSGRNVLYLRLYNRTHSLPYIELWDVPSWNRYHALFNMRTGLIYGIKLVLIPLILIQAVWSHQRGGLYLGLALCSYLLYEATYEGLAALWLWPQQPMLSLIMSPLSLSLGMIFITLFVLDAVPYRGSTKLWRKFLWAVPAIPLLSLAGLVLSDFNYNSYWMSGMVIAMSLILLTFILKAWHRGFRFAPYIWLILSLVAAAILVRIGVATGVWIGLYPVDLWLTSFLVIIVSTLLVAVQTVQLRHLDGLLARNLREIGQARDQANRASRSKSLLLARISHDLRTPLHTLMGYIDLAQRERPEGVMGRYLKMMASSAQKMVMLIDELLQFARGEEGRLELNLRPAFLHGLIQPLCAQAESLAAAHDNEFRLAADLEEAGMVVIIDSERLYSVLINLLSNACRATITGIVTLSVQSHVENGRVRLNFAVRDTGPGIAPEDQERIFLPFEHGSSDVHSVGLGLAIARQLVRLMGGELQLSSQPGIGADFHFSLMVAQAHEADVQPVINFTAPYGYNGPVCTLLVVDDVDENRIFMQDLLTGMGFDVKLASDVPEALNEIWGEHLSAAIVDQYLPFGTGWEILDAIKMTNPELPVVLLSAAPGYPPVNRTASWSFDAELLKPLRVDELTQVLGRLLNLVWRFNNTDAPSAILLKELPAGPMTRDDLYALRQMAHEGSLFEVEDWVEKWQHRTEERDFLERITPLIATARLSAVVQVVDRRLTASADFAGNAAESE